MTKIIVKLPQELPFLSVRSYLKQFQGISNSHWRRIKHEGDFHLNGLPVNATYSIVKNGDQISFESEKKATRENRFLLPENLPLEILYEDESLLVVNKPAHMLVHPISKELHGTLANAVMGYYQRSGQKHAYHPCHRLDRNTSGLILIAKEPQVQHLLTRNQMKHFHRDYLAISCGSLPYTEGKISLPLGKKEGSFIEQCVRKDEMGKPATTLYQVIDYDNEHNLSLLILHLTTGRTHQIRVHMAALGCPLLGDSLYGQESQYINRQALHAFCLTFDHPFTKEHLELKAAPPQDMQQLITKFFPEVKKDQLFPNVFSQYDV